MIIKMWIASDSTIGHMIEIETKRLESIKAAYEYGRAEAGEIINYFDETEQTSLGRVYWDDQHRKYRNY